MRELSPSPPELPPAPPPRTRRWWNPRLRGTRKTPDRPCLNCGDPTVGFYCPTCGQRKVEVRVSLRRMTAEAMEDELFLNATLPRTFLALFFRPGHLTREYVEGRMARYVAPLRLYLISSVSLFVLLPWVTNIGDVGAGVDLSGSRSDSTTVAAVAELPPRGVPEDDATEGSQAREGTGTFSINLGADDPERVPLLLRPVNRRMVETETRLGAMPTGEAIQLLTNTFLEHAPKGVFLMMPLFATLLKLLYLRRGRYFVEHFVFALHVHAFTFLTSLLMLLLPWRAAGIALLVWLMVYIFVAMKRVYGQGYPKTIVKYAILAWSYTFILVAGVLFTVMLTAFTL